MGTLAASVTEGIIEEVASTAAESTVLEDIVEGTARGIAEGELCISFSRGAAAVVVAAAGDFKRSRRLTSGFAGIEQGRRNSYLAADRKSKGSC